MDGSGRVMARSALSLSLEFDRVPPSAVEAARHGEIIVLTGENDRVRAVIRLARFVDAYLLVGRFVDSASSNTSTGRARGDPVPSTQRKAAVQAVCRLFILVAVLWCSPRLIG